MSTGDLRKSVDKLNAQLDKFHDAAGILYDTAIRTLLGPFIKPLEKVDMGKVDKEVGAIIITITHIIQYIFTCLALLYTMDSAVMTRDMMQEVMDADSSMFDTIQHVEPEFPHTRHVDRLLAMEANGGEKSKADKAVAQASRQALIDAAEKHAALLQDHPIHQSPNVLIKHTIEHIHDTMSKGMNKLGVCEKARTELRMLAAYLFYLVKFEIEYHARSQGTQLHSAVAAAGGTTRRSDGDMSDSYDDDSDSSYEPAAGGRPVASDSELSDETDGDSDSSDDSDTFTTGGRKTGYDFSSSDGSDSDDSGNYVSAGKGIAVPRSSLPK